jgi:hypothetical protein
MAAAQVGCVSPRPQDRGPGRTLLAENCCESKSIAPNGAKVADDLAVSERRALPCAAATASYCWRACLPRDRYRKRQLLF